MSFGRLCFYLSLFCYVSMRVYAFASVRVYWCICVCVFVFKSACTRVLSVLANPWVSLVLCLIPQVQCAGPEVQERAGPQGQSGGRLQGEYVSVTYTHIRHRPRAALNPPLAWQGQTMCVDLRSDHGVAHMH